MVKFGYVAVIGRPNAGKSTLVNTIVGESVAIVSNKPQTTRDNILGVVTDDRGQIVFVDTPGIHQSKNKLDTLMNKNVRSAESGCNLILYVIDGSSKSFNEDINYITVLHEKIENQKLIIAINKIDIARKTNVMPLIQNLSHLRDVEFVTISAKDNNHVDELVTLIFDFLPDYEDSSVYEFEDDEYTDKSINFLICETVREQLLEKLSDEIPHGVACSIAKIEEKDKCDFIDVDIFCEKQSHKNIIIGKGGLKLKDIGSGSREKIEKLLGKKVMLTLWVKVKKDWRANETFLSELGYKSNK